MDRKNTLKALLFDKPDYIPVNFVINDSCWNAYLQEKLLELISEHRLLFPNFAKPELPYTPKYANVAQKNHPYTDDWGCLWETMDDGITGTVTKHPLSDWANYPNYKIPDPSVCMGIGKIDWLEERKRIKKLKENGEFAMGGLRHGHTFLQICDIRGYEEAIFDMEDEEPLLVDLLEM